MLFWRNLNTLYLYEHVLLIKINAAFIFTKMLVLLIWLAAPNLPNYPSRVWPILQLYARKYWNKPYKVLIDCILSMCYIQEIGNLLTL